MKITILFASLADYTVAFFRHLALHHGWRIQLIYQPPKEDAPYAAFDLGFCEEALDDAPQRRPELAARVAKFGPDCVLMCSWNFRHYMRIARALRRRGVYVVSTMDNQWRGSAKQWLGVMASAVYLKPSIDTFLVAGDRQAQFASRLGYPDVLYGYYAADVARFARPPGGSKERPASFLFVGRLVEEKGLDILLHAYELYRTRVDAPWDLTIAGTGPLQLRLKDRLGIDYRGFVQPPEMPALMHQAAAFVLPSRFEPWGVVIHEAAAAGLPIICTTPCGASTYFVRDGVNGFLVPTGVPPLARAMERLACESEIRRAQMRDASVALARLWQPSMLARYFSEAVKNRLEGSSATRHAGTNVDRIGLPE